MRGWIAAALMAVASSGAGASTPLDAATSAPFAIAEVALSAEHWIARWPNASVVGLDAAAVSALNNRLFAQDPSLARLSSLPDAVPADAIRARIVALSTPSPRWRWFADGREVRERDRRRWQAALDLDGLDRGGARPLAWALVTRRAALRAVPTNEAVFAERGDTDLDRMQESAFFPGTPVAVQHASADSRWRFVVGATYAAWIEDDALAMTDRATALGFAARATRTVLDPVARLTTTPEAPAVSALALDMGVALPERRDAPLSQPVNGQSALASFIVEVPTRSEDGRLRIANALLPRSAASHDGPLPASRAHVMRQAFRFLGERYGWGHANDARDCSGFVAEIYRSVGITLPRNTGDQARSPALLREPLDGLDRAARRAAVGRLAPGDLIYLPGHVVMVVGHDADGPWVIHSVHRLRTRDADGALRAWPANGVVVTPLLPLQFDETRDYLDAATVLVRVLPVESRP